MRYPAKSLDSAFVSAIPAARLTDVGRDWQEKAHTEPCSPLGTTLPVGTRAIHSYHAHVYFGSPEERAQALVVHPNTGRARDDHLRHANWLGKELAVRPDVFSNTARGGGVSALETNTLPRLASE
jgi:hypothetical protein